MAGAFVFHFMRTNKTCEYACKYVANWACCMYNNFKGVMIMPNIKPISDLRNYTEVLKEVDTTSRVYLARNGHGEYGILTMAEIDELDDLMLYFE